MHHPKYRPDIDGLRAVAIILVVTFHAFPDLVPGGFIGVDIFFVISGFLISGIIIANLEHECFSFMDFYRRRIRRIFPSLLLVLSACFALGWYALLPEEYIQLGKHMAGGATFSSNFVLWSESGYFDNNSESKPLLHLWSLAVEEQFYLLWPVLLWFAWKRKLNLLHLSVGVCLISSAWNIAMIYENETYTFYSPQTRLWELMLGAILASLLQQRFEPLSPRWHKYAAPVGIALIGSAELILSKTNYFPGWWAFIPTLGAGLIIFADAGSRVNRLLAHPTMVWVGKISYPLYLWHWPLFSFAWIMEMGNPSAGIRCAVVLLSTALAWVTYELIELPIRAGRIAHASVVLVGLMAGVMLCGAATYHEEGFPKRKSLALSITKYESEIYWRRFRINDNCRLSHPEFAHSNVCIKAKHAPATILLLGDSHSNNLYPGLAEATANSADNVVNVAAWACPPFFNTEVTPGGENSSNSCIKRMRVIFNYAIESKSIKTIIVAARGPLYLHGTGYGITPDEASYSLHTRLVTQPELSDPRAVYQWAMRETLNRLTSSNKHIIFVLDNPELGFHPMSCVFLRPLSLHNQSIRQPCAIPREEFDKRNAAYREVVSSVLKDFPSVALFDTAKFFCDEKWCWAMHKGELLYRDDDHLSVAGSRFLVKGLMNLIHPVDSVQEMANQ